MKHPLKHIIRYQPRVYFCHSHSNRTSASMPHKMRSRILHSQARSVCSCTRRRHRCCCAQILCSQNLLTCTPHTQTRTHKACARAVRMSLPSTSATSLSSSVASRASHDTRWWQRRRRQRQRRPAATTEPPHTSTAAESVSLRQSVCQVSARVLVCVSVGTRRSVECCEYKRVTNNGTSNTPYMICEQLLYIIYICRV